MKKLPLTLFYIIFYTGALLGITLTTLAAWADLEATSYGFDRTGDKQLISLSCPILMTANETGSFSVNLTNSTGGNLSPSIKTDVSARVMAETSSTSVKLSPGESKRIRWEIGPENIEFGRFIFVRAWVYHLYPLPNQENTCGVFIVNLPTNGAVITWTMMILSLLGVGIGLFGLNRSRGTVQKQTVDMLQFNLLSIFVIAGLVTGFMGWWIQGVIIVVFFLLLLVVSVFTLKG